jgi:hypothetical protein
VRTHHDRPGLWSGLLLVSVGAGLLAREFGWLPRHVGVLDFWPLFVVCIGISVLLRASGVVSALLALAFIGTGSALLAGNLGFLTSSVTRLWPMLVVLLGLWALFRGGRGPEPGRPSPGAPDAPFEADGLPPDERDSRWEDTQLARTGDADRLVRRYFGAGAQLRIESQAWKGGELIVTAGGVELDLRNAGLDPDGAVLVVRVLMGGIDIRVPDTWQVLCDVTPVLGGADDLTRSTQGVSSAPRLRVTGNVTLGGVSIQN